MKFFTVFPVTNRSRFIMWSVKMMQKVSLQVCQVSPMPIIYSVNFVGSEAVNLLRDALD